MILTEETNTLSPDGGALNGRGMRFLRSLNSAAASLQRSAHSEIEVLRAFKKLMVELGYYGTLALLNESGERLVFKSVVYSERITAILEKVSGRKAEGFSYLVSEVDTSRHVMETGEALFLADTTETIAQILPPSVRPMIKVIATMLGKQAGIYAPMMVDGEAFGLVNISSPEMSEADVPSVIAFANHISVALTNARLFQSIRKMESRYRSLFDAAGDAILLVESNGGRILSANQKAKELLGHSEAELRSLGAADLVPKRMAGAMDRYLKISKESGQHSFELPLNGSNGSQLTVHISATCFESGERQLTQCVIRDVTQRNRAEMLQSATYRIATAANSDINLDELYGKVHSIVGELMDVSNFFIAIRDPELDVMTLPYFVDEMDNDSSPFKPGKGLTDYVIRTGQPQLLTVEDHDELISRGEAVLIGPQAFIWLGVPLKSEDETFGAIVLQHYRDANAYTEREKHLLEFVSGQIAAAIRRKQSEAALRESEERFRKIFDDGPLGMVIVSLDLRFQRVNRTFCEMLGFAASELAVLTLSSVVHPADQEANARFAEKMFAGEIPGFRIEERLVSKSGKDIWVSLTASVIHDGQGRSRYGLGMIEDITKRRRTEDTLRQAQKMESLGVLAGGVAHDFNNLLVAILGQSSLALTKLSSGAPAFAHIERTVKAAERASDLTRQLLAYSGRGQFELQPLQLNAIIEDNLHLLEAAIPKNVRLLLELTYPLPLIEADPGQMQQVVMNLILNAAEAIGNEPGTITAATGSRYVNLSDHRYWRLTSQPMTPGKYVALEIRDDGCGMGTETLTRIFDPFFSTKFTGRGLGLAAVLGIVRGHRGGLNVSSELGKGTTFKLLFPLCAAQDEVAKGVPPTKTKSKSLGYVLVIDDEEPVRMAVTDMLELAEIRVLSAADGQSGITLFEARKEEIDLVLLDLSMPGLGGEETLNELQKIDPGIKVVLSSGYNKAEVARRFEGKGLVGFIAKPYTLSTLIEGISMHLETSRQDAKAIHT